MKIFLSGASAQFKACRESLRSDLAAIGCEVKVQEDFQTGPWSLIERLEEYVAGCDRVIALVGDAYGSEASGDAVPGQTPPRSYTQWEYCFALGERLRSGAAAPKPVWVYFASDAFLQAHGVAEPDELRSRQRLFAQEIKASGKHWAAFDTPDQLCRTVLRDGWQIDVRPVRRFRRFPEDLLSPHFAGRESEFEALRQALPLSGSGGSRPVVIYGMGGCGKTQLALKFAFDRMDKYAGIWWFRAEEPEFLDADFELFCSECQVPRLDNEEPFAAATRWLAEQPRWLLVFDSAEGVEQLRPYLREFSRLQTPAGHHMLITSRNPNWSGAATTLPVRAWTADQAVAFLQSRLGSEEPSDMRSLSDRLGGHPLALELAAAFIGDTSMPLGTYLDLLASAGGAAELLAEESAATGYKRSVASTLSISVPGLSSPALELLRLCAGLAPERIPLEVFTASMEMLPADLARVASVPVAWNKCVGELLRYSLASRVQFVSRGQRVDGLEFHRLTQEVILASIGQSDHARTRLTLLAAALPSNPADPSSWSSALALLPHLLHVIRSKTPGDLDPRKAVDSLNRGAKLALHAGLPREADLLVRTALDAGRRLLGPEDPDTLTSMEFLALTLLDTGKRGDGQELFEEVLNIRQRVLEPAHPDTLRSMKTVADLMWLYDPDAAVRLKEEAVRISVAVRGEDDTETLTQKNNLAFTLSQSGNHGRAVAIHRDVLDVRRRLLGPEDSKTLISMTNLASALAELGRFEEAQSLHEQVVVVQRRLLGAEHPDTLASMGNLAHTLQKAGDLQGARDLRERVLEISRVVFGPEHPETTVNAMDLYTTLLFNMDDKRAASEVFAKDLAWLIPADPERLSEDQREIREWLSDSFDVTGEH